MTVLVLSVVAIIWIASIVFVLAMLRASTRPTWWESTLQQIARLPEADPEDPPRGRPSQDGRT